MPNRFRNITGPQIRKVRDSRGWTQEQLAAKLQLAGLAFDRVTVAKVESQIRSLLDFELVVMAEVLGIDPSQLTGSFEELRTDLEDLQRGERSYD